MQKFTALTFGVWSASLLDEEAEFVICLQFQKIIVFRFKISDSAYILAVVGSTKLAIPQLPFVWNKHFVAEENSADCVPACVAMCARMWNDTGLINIPTETSNWSQYFEKLGIHSHRGTNVSLVTNAMKKIKSRRPYFTLNIYYPIHIAELTKLLETNPVFPIILTYDRRMVQHNAIGVHHASLFYSFDVLREKVFVIDPASPFRTTPTPIDQVDFLRGWEETGNEIIIPHPSNIRVPINMRQKVKHEQLETYSKK